MSEGYADRGVIPAVHRGVSHAGGWCDHISAAQGSACYRDTARSIVSELHRDDLMIVSQSDLEKVVRFIADDAVTWDVLVAIKHLAMALYATERGEVEQ